jgi:hypothetical protein
VQAGSTLHRQVDLGAPFTREQVSTAQLGISGKTGRSISGSQNNNAFSLAAFPWRSQ